jgi:hypothetical protein
MGSMRALRGLALLVGVGLIVAGVALFDYRVGLVAGGLAVAGLFGVEVRGES